MSKGFKRFLSVWIVLSMSVGAIPVLAEDPIPGEATLSVESPAPEQTIVESENTPAATNAPESMLPPADMQTSESGDFIHTTPSIEGDISTATTPDSDEGQGDGATSPDSSEDQTISPVETPAPAETESPVPDSTTETIAPVVTETPVADNSLPVLDASSTPETDSGLEQAELQSDAADAELNATTEKVDASTVLPDGEYAPSDFTFSGGTGKTRISCSKVSVSGGQAKILIQFSSKNWGYVKANGDQYLPLDGAENKDGHVVGSQFEFPIDLNVANQIYGLSRAMGEPHEIGYSITATIEEKAAEPTYEDGDYEADASATSSLKMFNITGTSVKVAGGRILVTIVTEPTSTQAAASYNKIYLGSRRDDGNYPSEKIVEGVDNGKNGYNYTFEISEDMLGKTIDFVCCSAKNGKWSTSKTQYTITLPAAINKKPAVEPSPTPSIDIDDGEYNVDVDTGEKMFKVISCKLTAKGGKYTAEILLSGTGYDYLCLGSAADAVGAQDKWVKYGGTRDYTVDGVTKTGRYYTLSLNSLGETPVAAHSESKDQWYDRKLIFKADSLDKLPAPVGGFNVAGVSAVRSGGLLNVILTSSSEDYDRVYIGPKSQWNRSPYYARRAMADGVYYYSFTLPASYLDTDVKFVPGRADGTWYDGDQLTFKCTAAEKLPDTPAATIPSEGSYTVPAQVYVDNGGESYNNNSAFDAVYTEVRIEGEKLHVTVWNRTSFADALYIGRLTDADIRFNVPRTDDKTSYKGAEYRYDFTLPKSALGTLVPFVPAKNGAAVSANQLYLAISSDLTETSGSPAPVPTPTPTPSGDIGDGEYSVDVDTGEKMFKVVACKLTAKGGKYTAEILLSGTGYDYLCLGSAADAAGAQDKWVRYGGTRDYTIDSTTKTGRYYALSLDSLGETPVAAHSEKNDQWYDRKFTFKLDTLKKTGDVEADPTPTPAPSPTPEPTKAPESDLSGSTSKVDSSTSLKDGTYTPDKFSYSGGTGRVKLSCRKVTVSGGKATATLQFSSPNFSYVKANGSKIYGSHGGSSSTFEVPVKLNANNRIIGMTTAMTIDHEVEYTVYIYIEGADAKQDQAADAAGAPKIIGLNWQSSDALDHAKRFGVHRYQDGVKLIRVENLAEYLVVPENAELPVGVDEGRVRISQPVEKAFVASEDMLQLLADCGLDEVIERIAALGISEDQNPIEALTEKILRGEVALAGTFDAPEYAALLRQGCDLAILPAIYADPKVLGTDENAESQLDDDTAALLNAVVERLGMLNIPVFVDLSAQEETEEARLEWIKIYGVIFDCEAAANAAYARMTAEAEQAA